MSCPNTTKDFVDGEWKTVYTCFECGTEYPEKYLNKEAYKMDIPIKIPKMTCKICGYSWAVRQETKPKQCPQCKNPNWDMGRRRKQRTKKEEVENNG